MWKTFYNLHTQKNDVIKIRVYSYECEEYICQKYYFLELFYIFLTTHNACVLS